MKNVLKRGLSVFLAITIIFSSAVVGLGEIDFGKIKFGNLFAVKSKAASVDDLIFTLNDNGESYSVTCCDTSISGELIIPGTYNGLPVTCIGNYTFDGCTSLTSVTIPDSVTSIGDGAFRDCKSLTSVTIPDSVTSIGNYAFYNCTDLTSVTIPDGVTHIGEDAFYYCTSLTSVTIPDSVTSIGDYAFYRCNSLTSVYITDIAAWCNIDFKDNYSNPLYYAENLYINGELATEVIIPDGVTEIPKYAFSCKSLTSITIPDSVTSIGDGAFEDCKSLTSITIPDSVTSIGEDAFYYCTSLNAIYITDIAAWCNIDFYNYASNPLYYGKNLYLDGKLIKELMIPEGVTIISNYAFYNWTSLTGVTIPNSVTTIGNSAFSNCKALTSITIPDSATSIGNYAFYNCTSLTVINVDENNEYFSSVDGVLFNKDETTLIKYPEGKTDTEYTIPDSVTNIGSRAFGGCKNLSSVVIGDNATSIGDYAFYECTNLISVNIPNGVTSISDEAFRFCKKLSSITIPESVTSLGKYAFGSCGINSITIPGSVKNIGERAFIDCYYLNSVIIGNGVTSIGAFTFYECYGLTSVTIPESIISIDKYAFGYCNALSNVYYQGLLSSWGNITIGSNNTCLSDATISHLCTPGDWIVNEEPTCIKEGSQSTNCVVCGGIVIEAIETIDHSYSKEWTVDVEPTCIEEGSKSHHCTVCGDRTDITFIDAIGHSYSDEWTIDDAPTCMVGGWKSHHCTFCDDKTAMIYIEATGHSYGDWVIDSEPDCTEEGSKHKTCSACGDIVSEMVAPLGHDYSTDWTVDETPTCTEKGSKSHHCLRCDDKTDATVIEATGHNYGDWVITSEPTCTESGLAERVCNECGYKQDSSQNTEEILLDSASYPESKHNYFNNISEIYNFSYDSAQSLILTFSSSTQTESNYDYIYIYDESGELYGKYSGSTLAGKAITLNGDSFTIKLTSDSINTKYGFSFDTIVAVVDVLDITKPHGHSYGEEWTINVEPTCTKEGSKCNTCSVCGNVTTEVIDANGHSYAEEWTIDDEPTCTEPGSKSHHCTVCDGKTDITEILATGIHDYDEWVIDYEPTCFIYGLKHRNCKTCDLVEEEFIDVISHSEDYEIVIADDSLYSGEEVEPLVSVSYIGEILEYGTDYKMLFENNIVCGNSAKVTITGLGDYADLNVTKTFNIYKRDISEAEVYVEDCVYDRFQQKPDVTVIVDGIELTAEEDYVLDYINNSSIGTATVKVIGINNCYGSVEQNFEITYDNRTITLEGGNMGVNPTPSYNSIVMGPGKLKCTVPCSTKFLFSYKIKDGKTGEVIDSFDSGRTFGYSSSFYIYYDFSTLASSTELKDFLIQFSWVDYNANSYGGFLSVFINPSSPNKAEDFSLSILESSSIKNDYVLINTEYESYDIKTPVWTSSNNSIAAVENGIVTWLAPGTVTITAKTCGISKSVELTKERCDIAAYGEIVTAEYFYGEPAIGVTYDGELLEEGVDYSLTVTDYGEYSIAEVTGKNLFKGTIFKKFYNDCGSPYICEHTFSDWGKAFDGGCTKTTITTRYCLECGYLEKKFTSPIGHNYGDWVITSEPTCEVNGSKCKTCSNCGDVVAEAIDSIGHSYSTEWTIDVNATCTSSGSKSHHCTRCDAKADVTSIAATGHSYGDWVVTSEPTCIKEGLQRRTCLICDAVATKTIVPLGHDFSSEWIIEKAPTCTEPGSKYHSCSKCEIKSDSTVIAATGHSYGDWVVLIEGTCTEEGLECKTCSGCNDKIYEETYFNEYNHTDLYWVVLDEATVYECGYRYQMCGDCGMDVDDELIPQLKCSKPKLSKIENTADGVKITWGKVSGADSYAVYRKTGSGSYKKIGTTSKTSYTDKKASSGKKYYYYVKAVNEAGSSSASSSKSILHLADPTLKTPKSTKSGVKLTWSKVSGADGYMVYRKTGSGSYSKIATVKGYKKVTYTDKSAKKGKKYTYKVKAYKSKTYSAYSNTKALTDKY